MCTVHGGQSGSWPIQQEKGEVGEDGKVPETGAQASTIREE